MMGVFHVCVVTAETVRPRHESLPQSWNVAPDPFLTKCKCGILGCFWRLTHSSERMFHCCLLSEFSNKEVCISHFFVCIFYI